MGSDVGDIGHPSLIWLPGLELPAQVIGSHMGRLATLIASMTFVAALGADTFDFHESMHTVFCCTVRQGP